MIIVEKMMKIGIIIMSSADSNKRYVGALILIKEKIICGKVIGMIKTFTKELLLIDNEILPAKRDTDTTCRIKTI
jgi:hypothetical protein